MSFLKKTHKYIACSKNELSLVVQSLKNLYDPSQKNVWCKSTIDGATLSYKFNNIEILVDDHHMSMVSSSSDSSLPPVYTLSNHVIFVTWDINELTKSVPSLCKPDTPLFVVLPLQVKLYEKTVNSYSFLSRLLFGH